MASPGEAPRQPCLHLVLGWSGVAGPGCSPPCARRTSSDQQACGLEGARRAPAPVGRQQGPARVPVRPRVHRHARRRCCGPGRPARVKALPTRSPVRCSTVPALLFVPLRSGLRSACGLRACPCVPSRPFAVVRRATNSGRTAAATPGLPLALRTPPSKGSESRNPGQQGVTRWPIKQRCEKR